MTDPPSDWHAPGDPTAWSNPGSGAPGPPPPPTGYGPPTQPYYDLAARPGIVPLRPLGLGELLDGAIKVIRRYPRPTLGLSAAIAAVVTTLNVIVVLSLGKHVVEVGGNGTDQFNISSGSSASSFPVAILGLLAGLVLTGALVVVVGKAVLGQPVSAGEVWTTVRSRFWALLGLALLTGLIVFGPVVAGFLLLIGLAFASDGSSAAVLLGFLPLLGSAVLATYFYTRFALAPAALVLEKASVRQALGRSSTLIRGAWWRTFWILVLTSLIGSVITGILGVPIGLAALFFGTDGSSGYLVAVQVASGVASVLVSPFTAGVHALLYVDRRMRAEGLDVALASAAIGLPSA